MTFKDIKDANIKDLLIYVENANSQAELNSIIYKLACRTYVPFSGVNFDDLLLSYGYKIETKVKEKIK